MCLLVSCEAGGRCFIPTSNCRQSRIKTAKQKETWIVFYSYSYNYTQFIQLIVMTIDLHHEQDVVQSPSAKQGAYRAAFSHPIIIRSNERMRMWTDTIPGIFTATCVY
jgi:hypothetical protein